MTEKGLPGKKARISGTENEWMFTAYLGKDANGKQKRVRHRFKNTKQGEEATEREADYEFRAWLNQMEKEIINPPKKPETLGEYLEFWLSNYVKPTKEARTYESYRDEIKRHIAPEIGHIPLTSLSATHIQKYLVLVLEDGRKDSKGGLSPRTVEYHRAILSKALNQAVDLDKISANPVKKTVLAKKKTLATDKNKLVLDAQQLEAFLRACENEYYYTLVYVAAYSGMRLSELLGLTWDCIDWENNTIEVNKSAHISEEHGNAVRPGVKSESSHRTIDVDPSVMEILRVHQIKQMSPSKKRKRLLPESKLPLVFKNRGGNPYQDNNVQRRFRVLSDKYGLPAEFSFHNLRHTHASILVAAGWSIKEVSERLGHADIVITLRYYVRVIPNENRRIGSAFGDLIRQDTAKGKSCEIITLPQILPQ